MKSTFLRWAMFLLIALFLFTGCRRSVPQNIVVLYCSADQTAAEPVIAEFEKASGIKVLVRFDSEATKTVGLAQKIRAEASRPLADVFWSNEIFNTILLNNEGLLVPFQSEQTQDWPGPADTKGCWHGFALRARVIAYNNKKISDKDAPKSLEELTDSKWQGRIVIADPGFGTTGGDVASWFVFFGDTRAIEILRAFAANKVRLVEGNSTAVRMVASGQADVCLTDTDDVYAAVRNGWPVAMNYLDLSGSGCLAIPNTAAIIKGAPHKEQAEKLVEYLLSRRCEEILAESDSHNTPVNKELAEKYNQYAFGKTLKLEYEKIAELMPGAIKQARELLR